MHRSKLGAVASRVLPRRRRQPITLDFFWWTGSQASLVIVLGFIKAPAVILDCKPVLIEIPFW